MAASHSGEDRHVRTVQAVLRAGGLTREVLACGVHPPSTPRRPQRLIRDGEPLTAAAPQLLGQARRHGAARQGRRAGRSRPTGSPTHPVQQPALDTVATSERHRRAASRHRHRWLRRGDASACRCARWRSPLLDWPIPRRCPDPALRRRARAHPRRDDGAPGAGRRRTARVRYRADARRAGPPRFEGGAEGVQAVGLLRGAAGRSGGSRASRSRSRMATAPAARGDVATCEAAPARSASWMTTALRATGGLRRRRRSSIHAAMRSGGGAARLRARPERRRYIVSIRTRTTDR